MAVCLALTTPALAQPTVAPDQLRRERPYRPRHLIPLFASLAALGLVCAGWLRVRRAKAEALERL